MPTQTSVRDQTTEEFDIAFDKLERASKKDIKERRIGFNWRHGVATGAALWLFVFLCVAPQQSRVLVAVYVLVLLVLAGYASTGFYENKYYDEMVIATLDAHAREHAELERTLAESKLRVWEKDPMRAFKATVAAKVRPHKNGKGIAQAIAPEPQPMKLHARLHRCARVAVVGATLAVLLQLVNPVALPLAVVLALIVHQWQVTAR